MKFNIHLLDMDLHVDRTETYVTALYNFPDGTVGVGTAKRAPGDAFDLEIGKTLAMARVLRDVADWYEANPTAAVADKEVEIVVHPTEEEQERAVFNAAMKKANNDLRKAVWENRQKKAEFDAAMRRGVQAGNITEEPLADWEKELLAAGVPAHERVAVPTLGELVASFKTRMKDAFGG